MKVCVVLAVLVAGVVAEAPSPLFRPSGRLLLLPARLENPTPTPTQATVEKEQLARLVDSGEYYVLLPDGRLQMVKYSTAALKEQTPAAENSPSKQQEEPVEVQPAPFAQFQVQYLQFPETQKSEDIKQEKDAQEKDVQEKDQESGFQANLEYRDVKPISAPIYAYNPTPLVRVLRR